MHEAKKLDITEESNDVQVRQIFTWKDKIFNIYLIPLTIVSLIAYSTATSTKYYSENELFYGVCGFSTVLFFLLLGYLDVAGLLETPGVRRRVDKVMEGFGQFFGKLFSIFTKIFGSILVLSLWLIGIAIVCLIIYFAFSAISSATIPVLLTIIILILLFK